MVYNLNEVQRIVEDVLPQFGRIGFYMNRSVDYVERIGMEDLTLSHPKRFGVHILGRPDVGETDIESFMDIMKYMGFESYYWDYDKWGMLYFEFTIGEEDEYVYDIYDMGKRGR